MAITNFIPTIWSENLTRALDQQYIGVAHCNREYEGEIKSCGSTVKICGVGNVNILDYTKNADMSLPQDLSDTVCDLTINQAKYFNFQIDDVDRAQSSPKLMEAAMHVAAQGLARDADRYVYSLYSQAKHSVLNDAPTTDDIIYTLLEAREMLFDAGVSDPSDVVLEVTPKVASLILKAKLITYQDGGKIMETGTLGHVVGCPIYVSPNVVNIKEESTLYPRHKCLMRTRRAVAFAEQLSEIEAYRPEKRFADAVKGLHLYGASIVYPDEFILLDFGID